MNTHAVININTSEYESYMRRKNILEKNKIESKNQVEMIQSMRNDIDSLKIMIEQLLNRDLNGSTTS